MTSMNISFVDVPIPLPLRACVQRMVGFVECGAPAMVRSELPSLSIPLILVLGRGYTQHKSPDESAARNLAHSFVAGPHQRVAHIGSDGWSVCIQIDLTTLGAFRLLQCHMADLVDEIVEIEDVLGASARELEQRLIELTDWPTRFKLVLDFLTDRLRDAPCHSPVVEHALFTLDRERGALRIQALAAMVGCSRKHLSRLFAREIGLTPKQVARLRRFQQLPQLMAAPGKNFAEVAQLAGYADQSHMNHELALLTGMTPTEFCRR